MTSLRRRLLVAAGLVIVVVGIGWGLVMIVKVIFEPAARRHENWVRACEEAGGWVHESTPPMCIVDGRIVQVGT